MNISKETTKRELSVIDGVSEKMRRIQGINMIGGDTNAVEIACGLYGVPSFNEMLDAFNRARGSTMEVFTPVLPDHSPYSKLLREQLYMNIGKSVDVEDEADVE